MHPPSCRFSDETIKYNPSFQCASLSIATFIFHLSICTVVWGSMIMCVCVWGSVCVSLYLCECANLSRIKQQQSRAGMCFGTITEC